MSDVLKVEIPDVDQKINFSGNEKKKTSEFMTKYEYTMVLAARASQIRNSIGEPIKVEHAGIYDPLKIAELEMHARVIPIVIVRILKNGEKEFWKIKDMHFQNY